MPKRDSPESQLSFLAPDDAVLLHQFRMFMAEATRLYETRTGRVLEDALAIRSPREAYEFLRLEMEGLEQEQLRVVCLNTRNRIVGTHMIYQGSVNAVSVRIGEVYRPALLDNASSLIVAHNHPSGDPEPSPEDVSLTGELAQAGQLLGVQLLDHLIIGRGKYVSLKERGLGFDPSTGAKALKRGSERRARHVITPDGEQV